MSSSQASSPAAPDSKHNVKAEPRDRTSAKTVSSRLDVGSVRRGWFCLYDGPVGQDLDMSSYLVKQTPSWAETGFQLVFTPEPSRYTFPPYGVFFFSQQERDEILIGVAKALIENSDSGRAPQPQVHFEGRNVHVSGLSRPLLLALSASPPTVRGSPMKLVKKGLPFDRPHVKTYSDVQAMKLSQFIAKFHEHYKSHYAKDIHSDGLQAAFASYYEINGLAQGPIFAGELILMSTGEQVLKRKAFFEKRPFSGHCDFGYYHDRRQQGY